MVKASPSTEDYALPTEVGYYEVSVTISQEHDLPNLGVFDFDSPHLLSLSLLSFLLLFPVAMAKGYDTDDAEHILYLAFLNPPPHQEPEHNSIEPDAAIIWSGCC